KARGRRGSQHLEATLEQWESTFSAEFAGRQSGPSFVGWTSSYTREAIPEAEMQEWLDGTIGRISSFKPQRLLEIGCGVGLLLQHLAPECEVYRGTDLSAAAIEGLRRWVGSQPRLGHVELSQQEAADLKGIAGPYDTVVLNSVVQYFPDVEYLVQV